MTFSFPVISADSHITEPPDCYTAHIDPAWRDRAPHMVSDDARGDMFVIPGMSRPIAMGLVAAAGKPAEELTVSGVSFDELHRSGWDPNYRIADQQRDGVAAEVIYPTVGMMICNHPDADFKHAAFTAYNRWIADYCSVAPDRLLGCGQTALRSVDEGIADLQRIADLGLKGVMMPGEPATWSEDGSGDYDDPMWDPFWQAAIDLGLPLVFIFSRLGPAHSRVAAVRGSTDSLRLSVFKTSWALSSTAGYLNGTLTSRWCVLRLMLAGCRTTCIEWITHGSDIGTGWRQASNYSGCRRSTSQSTFTPHSKTTGRRFVSPSR